jgi:aconitate hydratase
MAHQLFDSLQTFDVNGTAAQFYSLPQLETAGVGPISKLPVSIRIVLESVLRNCDGQKISEDAVRELANWQAHAERTEEIPFVVARIVLQDFTGVPLLVDLAAMRAAAARLNADPKIIEPLVPVDLVVDHSVQVDFSSVPNALQLNMDMEFKRNGARYQFLKWGTTAFDNFSVVPPGIGIVHQVNLEYLAKGVLQKDGVYYPDTLVGTDSHTTMINGLGIVGWGVGGIEAEAGMLGQPVYFLTPDVVGVHMSGALQEASPRPTWRCTSPNCCVAPKSSASSSSFTARARPVSPCPTAPLSPIWRPNMAPRWASFRLMKSPANIWRRPGVVKNRCRLSATTFRRRACSGCPKAAPLNTRN